jgi:hypothetical protein
MQRETLGMNNGPFWSENGQVGKGPPYGSDSKTAENHAANLLEKLIKNDCIHRANLFE